MSLICTQTIIASPRRQREQRRRAPLARPIRPIIPAAVAEAMRSLLEKAVQPRFPSHSALRRSPKETPPPHRQSFNLHS
jgi:hypothetical protein